MSRLARRVSRYGTSALLVECGPGDVVGLLTAIEADDLAVRVDELVPGAQSILVSIGDESDLEWAAARLAALAPALAAPGLTSTAELAVSYDGEDLEFVASECGISVQEVINRHTGVEYTVAFCGFAPGFAYLTGLDPILHLPRRQVPRPRVPAGSVAIAAGYAAVYPRESPGGWHLLGTCSEALFTPDTEPPARLMPGMRVRFAAAPP